MLMNTKYEIRNKIKKRNIVFYDSNFGRKNITKNVPSFDFVESKFGVEIDPSSVIADIGCGTASNLLSLDCNERIGLDISHVNLSIARERNSKLTLVQADAEHIPFREQVFDAVLIVDLLHHVPNPRKVVEEVSKILSEDGRLFIYDACVDGVKPIYPVATFVKKISDKISNIGDIEHFGPSLIQVNRWLKENDLKILGNLGEASLIRYIDSALECFLKRTKIPLSCHIKRIRIMMDSKFEISVFKKFPLKFRIIAAKGSVSARYEDVIE